MKDFLLAMSLYILKSVLINCTYTYVIKNDYSYLLKGQIQQWATKRKNIFRDIFIV